VKKLVLLFTALIFAGSAYAAQSLPEVSHDGLHLQKGSKVAAVYKAEGADLSQYKEVALLEAYVAFKKNWKRDYNRNEVGLDGRINDREMKKIRDEVAKEFNKVFTEVLSTEGGHKMVTEGAEGVLIIRPAIINLEVTAPDLMTASMSRTASGSAGQLTLYMELLDGKTGALIYRVIDPEAAGNDMWQIRNEVTNRADMDRVLKRWATLLNDQLSQMK
jgi:Protein of unknown function (DUF3313)